MSTLAPPIAMHDTDFLVDKLQRLVTAAESRGLAPVLTLAQSVRPEPRTAWHSAMRSESAVIANIEVADAAAAATLIGIANFKAIDVLLDASTKGPASQTFRELLTDHPGLGVYSDLAVWSQAILAWALQHLTPGPLSEVILVGSSPLTDAVMQQCVAHGYDTSRGLAIVGAEPGPLALIGTSFHTPVVDAEMLAAIASDGVAPSCMDGGIGSFTPEAQAKAHDLGWPVWRPDMRAALVAAVEQAQQYRRLFGQQAGEREIAGVRCVAGGILGHAGDLVLDRIDAPTEILGWADGAGGLLRDSADAAWLAAREKVHQELGCAPLS